MLFHGAFALSLHTFSLLFALVHSTPTIGIIKDYGVQFPLGDTNGFHSYSGVIEFEDPSIPGDSSKMSDAQFVNLAMVAYNEMIEVWKSAQLYSNLCPKALVAFESQGVMYFASSVRGGDNIDLNDIDKDIEGSVGWFQDQCQKTDGAVHRNGGGCAEPNSLRLYGDLHPPTGDPLTYQRPPTTDASPRMAAIVRTKGSPNTPNNPNVKNIPPCADTADKGYGCEKLVREYGFKAIQNLKPDTDGQDDWKFKPVNNPRNQLCQDPTASDGERG